MEAWLEPLDRERMTELVIDAWTMTVPEKVWTAYRETMDSG